MEDNKKKVIFVDDEPHVLSGLRRMLRSCRNEFDMSFAEGGEQALIMMAETPFHIVVTDVQMPGMDGGDLLEKVAEKYPGMVRLVLSGYASSAALPKIVRYAHQFMSKPCEAESLISTLKRAWILSDLLASRELQRLLASFTSIPSVPDIYNQLMEVIRSEDGSIEEVGEIISQDPAMSGKILQIVNSAFYGLQRRVSSPEQAATILGMNTIKDLALGIAVFNQIPEDICKEFQLDAMWNHSNRIGHIAKLIGRCEKMKKAEMEILSSAGLFHDFGSLIMASCAPDKYRQILAAEAETGRPAWELEQEIFGATHAEICAYILGVWGLPSDVMYAVACHHTIHPILNSKLTYAAIINIADALDEELVEGNIGLAEKTINHELIEAAGFSDRIDDWKSFVSEQLES